MTPEDSNAWFDTMLTNPPLIAILRGLGTERTLEMARHLWDLGLRLLEIPLQSDRDLDALAVTAEIGADRGFAVGAGTITSPALVDSAFNAGARFTVSPGWDPEVAHSSLSQGMPTLPGVFSPTEVLQAERVGLRWLKAFPAVSLGTDWFSAMRAPFPKTRLIAVGGMDVANAREFLEAGAHAVALGSSLTRYDQATDLETLLRR